MAEIAKLVEVVFSDKASNDLSQRLPYDSPLKLGLEKFYSILKLGVQEVGKGQLGLDDWEQSQVQAVASVAYAIAYATRSLSVEQVEPIIISVLQESLEYAICYLEKSVSVSDDLTVQTDMVQILEIALSYGTGKESDLPQPCFANMHVDSLSAFATGHGKDDLGCHIKCMLQGGSCLKEENPVGRMFLTLAAECVQSDNLSPPIVRSFSHQDVNKLASLCQHWAVAHLDCVRRLILLGQELFECSKISEEKVSGAVLHKKLLFSLRIFKLLRVLAKDIQYIEYDVSLLLAVASFADVLPSLFRFESDYDSSGVAVESNLENLVLLLLDEFLLLVQSVFGNSNVFQNIQACVAASIFATLDTDVWSYNKAAGNLRSPLAYFPRIVCYMLKLIIEIKQQTHEAIGWEELSTKCFENRVDLEKNSPACHVHSDKVVLLKVYNPQERLRLIFPTSNQWLGNLMHLVLFLHAEGVKLSLTLERSYSSAAKVASISEVENAICHEEDALFGDLFSEAARSVGSADGYDQPPVAVSSVTNICNMPFQAASELLSFLKTCVFSRDWHHSIYEDSIVKLNGSHIDILISILNCQCCCYENKTSDGGIALHEQRKNGSVHELCFGLLHHLLWRHVLSASLQEYLIEQILKVENGIFLYNDQTLTLIAHALICQAGESGNPLRTKLYEVYVDFLEEKANVVCSDCPKLNEFVETLPFTYHLEILLIAFHLSSDMEKAILANMVFSALKKLYAPSKGFNNTQLSCCALLISRLLLVLRHMIYYPRSCPSSLLLDLRSKFREAQRAGGYPPDKVSSHLSSWVTVAVENLTATSMRDGPVSSSLLSQLVDIAPLPASLCNDDIVIEQSFLSWADVCDTFSQILSLWRGRNADTLDDLLLERYVFVLCWDVPMKGFTVQHLPQICNDIHRLDPANMEHFFSFSHSFFGYCGLTDEHVNFLEFILAVLQCLDLTLSGDSGELGWDFLRNGLWLSLVLSLLTTGVRRYCMKNSISQVDPLWSEQTTRDNEFLTFAEGLVFSVFRSNQVPVLLRTLSSLLNKYIGAYQKSFLSAFGSRQSSPDKVSLLLLLKYTGFDICMQDGIFDKAGVSSCQLNSAYDLLPKLDESINKMSLGIRSKVFWECMLHGFPCQVENPSSSLISCILSIREIIDLLDRVFKVKDALAVPPVDTEVLRQISDSVMTIKSDKMFASLHGKCESVYCNLTESLGGPDFSYLFLLKHIEESLRDINLIDVDCSIHEWMVNKAIDTVDSIRKDPSKASVLRFFMSVEDVSTQFKDLYGSHRGDLLVLFDSLDKCNSELVNVKVLTFFIDIISGETCPGMKRNIQERFLKMDLLSLSKWLEKRLLGLVAEASGEVSSAKGSSVSLRESTMNLIACLLSPSSELQSRELHSHIFEAMLITLDNAFLLFDTHKAKSFFTFIVQLSRGESSIKSLLQRTLTLMKKLAGDEHLLQGLKILFGFLGTILSDCGSGKNTIEKCYAKSSSSNSSGLGPIASRSLSSRRNSETLVISTNQGGGSSLDCDATSADEDEDDGTSDGEGGSMDKDDEEDSNSERSLASKVCTFTSSGSNFMEQHWYFCYTCDLTVSKGCCSVCAKVCHRGHRVVYSRSSRFFCDCGAGGVRGSSCQCLKPRKFTGTSSGLASGSGNFQAFLPFADNGVQLPDSDSEIDEDSPSEIDNVIKLSIPGEVRERMALLLEELDVEDRVLELCSLLLPSVTCRRDSNLSKDKKIVLGEDKVLSYGVDLLQLRKAYKSGSLDLKIKADYSNAKELKSHLASGSLFKSLLSSSNRGRLAVGEGDKVAIFDIGQLIGQATVAPVTADKANVKPLSKNVVRFEIVHLVFNPVVENYLAVAGYEDCQVLTVSHRGEVTDRLAVELALQGAYIRRVDWVPGSQVQLMVVTNKFIKIYDLSQDNISPMHYFTLPDDMIVDATIVLASQQRMFLVVLSELGSIFRLEMSVEGNVGAKPLKEVIKIHGKDVVVKGSSLYYSPTYKLLFLSYQDGTALIGRLNHDATSFAETSAVYEDEHDGKLRPAGLHRWRELLVGSGLFVCFSTVKSNGALSVSIGEHELFAQNLRHSVGSTSPLVGITAYKPLSKDKIHCLVLNDDGSLQIYSHVSVGVDANASAMSDKLKRLGFDILNSDTYAASSPEFPLDFFEKTLCITGDVKLKSDAIRNGDSEGAKQNLASEDGFLESSSPAGFKVTVSNSNPDIVMVGLRVHVGSTSASHIPSSISVFQREVKLDEGTRSWYDIPFTVAESLLADEEFTISIGPTFNGSNLPRIDSLEVYGRAKDEFGWKEKMEAILHMEARVLGSNPWGAGSEKKCRVLQSAPVHEQVLSDGLKLLSRFYSLCRSQGCSKVDVTKLELNKLKCKQLLESIFESDKEPLLQAAACRVLHAVFPKRETYLQVKDTMRLLGVVKSTSVLSSRLAGGGTTAGCIVEEFTAQMRAVSRIALHRRSNLASFLETNGSEVVDGLMQVLWGILDIEQPDTQTMNNIVVSSVELIYCYAECLALHGKDVTGNSVAPAVSLFRKLLFSSNEAVQTSSSLAISSRLLQVPFPKQTMVGADDAMENATAPSHIPANPTSSARGNTQMMVEEDSITSSVQYCCDGCSTVPILCRRWHCSVCPDFDLCEACYEVLDADRLPSPHSRDHPMSAIPIEVETLAGEANDIHFPADDLGDSSMLPIASQISRQTFAPSVHVLEPNESGEFSTSVIDPVTISASKRAVNSLLLSELLKQLKGWMAVTSGIQAIPVMQLFYRLSSAVGGPFVDSLNPESLDLEKLAKWFLDEIDLNKPFAVNSRSSSGEVTILVFMFFTLMLRNWHQPGADALPKSSGTLDTHEKSTPPSTSVVTPSSLDDQEKQNFTSQLHRACGSLRQQAFVNYLMDILQQLVHVFKSQSVHFDPGHSSNSGCGALLTVRRDLPVGNFSPFFSDSYAKSHRADIFADYHRLLLENAFRLVYSLVRPEKHDKTGEKEKANKNLAGKDLKLDGYQDVLCSYINNPLTTSVRRYARRLFLHLCGSKTHYYSVRDSWQFLSEVKKLHKYINKSGGFQSTIPYERSVKIVKCVSTIAEVAAARPRNWQKYCLRHGDVLAFLMDGIFYLGEESAIQALKLLNLAFYTGKDGSHSLPRADMGDGGTTSTKSGAHSVDAKKKKKGEDGPDSGLEKSYLDMEPVIHIFTAKGGDILRQFIDCFLLEWNSSSVRGEAKNVLYGLWHHGKQSLKEIMLIALLNKVQCLPMYGQNIVEYTDLVTCFLGKVFDNNSKQHSSEIVDQCLTSDVIQCIFDTLHSQNELLANHPNSGIYNTLSSLVEFEGYYLESEPCVACSSPEVPYSRMKLESLKSETKFTDNRIIVKCTGSYTIQSVTMNVYDARKSKSVKVLNLYYNNRPVADLSELKNNWSLWKRAKSCHLAFNQTELKVEFPIPITACNFMIELDSFYENLQALSLEPLQCPRCSRAVTDKHGICGNCHENAYQCRQCRNINYENLDSFLCNECGYSKYGRFEFNFMAKPSFSFDSMENDEDMKRGLAAIESESENAHRRYQQLLGFKKPLLKIVSSIGENDIDAQHKDSVQQMMVSLPGPSCKINRKIALLGVLYGEKCKAAFDSVSKSVQTLQGLRQALMNYLHQKNSDSSVASSRFVVSRSPSSCYGCASTFVTQCLEILQVLSKHPRCKKQLVSAGILSELFENNIHQGPKTARVQARAALCTFSESDMDAVVELNSLIQKKVLYCLEHHRSMDIALATREELLLLSEVCSLADEFWESRLRVVFQLLFSSIKLGAKHPAICEHVILPCLKIISQACTPPKPDTADKEQGTRRPVVADENVNPSVHSSGITIGSKSASEAVDKTWDGSPKTRDIQLLSYSEWEKGASYLDFVRRQYKVCQAVSGGQRSRPQRYDYLALKYALRWKRRACKTKTELTSFELGSWVTELILSACSQSIRSEMSMLITLLCGQSSSRQFRLLNLLMSLLPATLSAGENAAEYFEMLFKMIDSEDARLFLTVRGCLATICKLIGQEVSNVEALERSLRIDISQGFILNKLIELLGKFLEVPNIRSRFMQERLLSQVLEAFIIIRGLIVQKTKLISDCSRLLKDLLDSILFENDENKRQFIQACISGLQIHGRKKKGRTSLFILEQLCNLISPSKPEPVYLLVLNKAHTQEEFIRGSMTKNPYSSAEIGPLMRDVKNKICHQLDLLGLLEDDFGMELLVAGNIISLDLTVAQVYEQVWKKSNSQSSNTTAGITLLSSSTATPTRDCPPMNVTYRLQGLDGEATEPMIKELEEDREESQDPEVEFAIAGTVRECAGLEIILGMIQHLRDDLKSNQEQLVVVLNLLMLCCKIRENRRALLRLGALNVLLETARHAFSVDAIEPAEGILLIVESLTLEANESDNISITQSALTFTSGEAGAGEQAKKIVLMFLERLSHSSGLKKSNKQQRNNEMVARILPYLTYGEPAAMEALILHFDPYLHNWGQYDQLQKQYEENPKDDGTSELAMKQRFAVENFVRVSESLKTSSCGERLKDIILEKGITEVAVRHLRESFSFIGKPGFKYTDEWVLNLKLPSVPLILSMLRGLSMGHLVTQRCIDEGGILQLLHTLEGVSGESEIGARAENLLDTLSDKEGKGDGFLADKVHELRHATRDEMRRLALKRREEMLQGLGMRQEVASDGGERIIVTQPILEGFEDVEEEEDGLACMVCREGYSLRPTDLLGVYSYSKRVNLGVGTSGSARGECVYTTVSHFNIIHFQCHQEAKRADAALKNPKKEWEGAALRNNETLCNNLFPLRGPSVPLAQYSRCVDLYWDNLNALGRADGSRIRLLTYDIVLMLARFATGASFSADCKGGGKESNSRFLPFMIQMACYLLEQGNLSQRHTMAKAVSTYLTSTNLDSKSSSTTASGTQFSVGTEETVQFMMVNSLVSESYDSWLQHRRGFLQRGIYHAYMQHTHGRPAQRPSSNQASTLKPDSSAGTSGTDDLLSIIQPMLVYTGLIEQLQRFFKVKKSANHGSVPVNKGTPPSKEDDGSGGLADWEVVMKEKLLNVREMVGFSKELLSQLEEMTSAEDLQEAFDIIGVLSDVLSGGFTRCEDFVNAAISGGRN